MIHGKTKKKLMLTENICVTFKHLANLRREITTLSATSL